jgi:hypothetical protein
VPIESRPFVPDLHESNYRLASERRFVASFYVLLRRDPAVMRDLREAADP